MNTRIAIIDLGTNTFHLLIADVAKGRSADIVLKETIPVKLGEGGMTNGRITNEALERGFSAMQNFNILIKQYQVNEIKALATAALRTASNGAYFIKQVKLETAIEIELIDGNREAELIYKGVREAVKLSQETALIMDIGGGSVEFILCNASQLLWKKSYPIGAAKLMELFHHSDPISKEDVYAIHHHLQNTLTELTEQCRLFNPLVLIGSAGAFETFANLVSHQFNLPKDLLNEPEFIFNKDQFMIVADQLLKSTHQQRLASPQIVPVRVDMIVVATILTLYVINLLKMDQIKLSTYALKEGILFEFLNER